MSLVEMAQGCQTSKRTKQPFEDRPIPTSSVFRYTTRSTVFSTLVDLVSHAPITTVEFSAVVSGRWEGKVCKVEVSLISLALIASTGMSPLRDLDLEMSRVKCGPSVKFVSSGLQVLEGFESRGPGTFYTEDDDLMVAIFFKGECMSSVSSRSLFTPGQYVLNIRDSG